MKMSRLLGLAAVALVVVNYAPEALAFPYHQRVGRFSVYSDAPPGPNLPAVLAHADALVAAGPIPDALPAKRLFLTDGGWRWRVLTLNASGAFGLTRPLSNAIVVNRSDVAADRFVDGRAVGGRRTLSGVVAHETMHLLLGRRYGAVRMAMQPSWKTEGFADYVARESSLSDADVARLRAARQDHPALLYYEGRRKVAAALAGGETVDALFAD